MPALTLALLATLAAVFALTPFALFRARQRFGLLPLWIYVGGAVVFMQFVAIGVPVAGATVPLTSVALFPTLLSLALLIYVQSDIAEARRFILTIIAVTVGWSLLSAAAAMALRSGGVTLYVSMQEREFIDLLISTPRTMLASAAALLVDVFLILISWQWLENHTRLPFVLRAFTSLSVTLTADSAIFVLGAFWPAEFVPGLLTGHLVGKTIAAASNACLLWAYTAWFETPAPAPDARGTLDILRVTERLEQAERALETSEQRYRTLFGNILDPVVVVWKGRVFDMNRRAEALLGLKKEDLGNSSASELGLPAVTESFEAAKLRLRDGREVAVEAAGLTMDVGGQEMRLVTIRDVSERERAADLIRRKNRELEALNSVAELGIRNVPVHDVLEAAVRKVQELTGTDSAALCLADEAGKALSLEAGTGISAETRKKAGEIRFGLLWKVFQTGQALVENDLQARSEARRDLMEKGVTVHATVAAPIVSRGRVIGTLSACSYRPRTFGAEDASLLGTLGAQLGAVIENARLKDSQREQREVAEVLLAAATAFGRARTVDELAEAMLDAVTHASGRSVASLLLYDEDRDTLTCLAMCGVEDAARAVMIGRTWGPNNPPTIALRTRRRTLIVAAEEGRRLDEKAWDSTSPGCIALLPLFQQARLLGAIAVNFDSEDQAAPETIAVLEGLAGLCAASLANLNLWGVAERRAALGATLLAAGQELSASRDPERVARIAAARAMELLGSEGASVWLESPAGLKAEAQEGALARVEGREVRIEALAGSRDPASSHPRAVADLGSPDATPDDRELAALLGARSLLAVPIRAGGRVLGVLAAANAVPRIHAREDVTAMETLATYTAVCLQNARLLQDLSLSNEEIRGAQQQVVRAESLAAIGRLSAAIAHEVRNPLSGISAAAQALLRSAQPDTAPGDLQLLRIIDRESKRLNRIITDFLQFARPRPPALRRVSVPMLVDSTLSVLEADLGGRYRIQRDFAPDTPAARADGDQLKQVLINLVLNAAQAMTSGGALTFRTRAAELGGQAAVELSIEDSGPGIPAADLARIFEPFFSTKKDGTGLGLAIAHQIVQAHGGTIDAHAAPAGGAVFRILLPAAQETAALAPAQLPARAE